jgi:hypothetical protein
MRTKTLKVNNENKKCVLLAGGPGFKIYTVEDYIIVSQGRRHSVIRNGSEFNTVMSYVNLKYQPASSQDDIKNAFQALLLKLGE